MLNVAKFLELIIKHVQYCCKIAADNNAINLVLLYVEFGIILNGYSHEQSGLPTPRRWHLIETIFISIITLLWCQMSIKSSLITQDLNVWPEALSGQLQRKPWSSALLALCEGNTSVIGGFHSQKDSNDESGIMTSSCGLFVLDCQITFQSRCLITLSSSLS